MISSENIYQGGDRKERFQTTTIFKGVGALHHRRQIVSNPKFFKFRFRFDYQMKRRAVHFKNLSASLPWWGERQGRLPSFYKLTRKGNRDQPDPYLTYISIWLHQHLAYIGFHTRFL